MYVVGIHGKKKIVKHDNFFEGQIGKILKDGKEDYYWGILKNV